MIEINKNVVFVQGAVNGAIYRFDDGEVFSVNRESCAVINKVINGEQLTSEENGYAELLRKNGLIDDRYSFCNYSPEKPEVKLSLCWLELTQKCNCRCIHCYEGSLHLQSENQLTLDEWKGVIDQLKELNVGRVVVIGGEPCLYSDVEDVCEYLCQNNIDTTFFTNGTLINESLKKIIVDNKIRMKFSLYGHNSEIHDAITKRKGSFDALISSIRFFLSHDVDVSVAVILMKENERFKNEITAFLSDLGVKRFRFDVIREVFGGVQSEHIPEEKTIINLAKRTAPSFRKTKKEKFDRAYFYNTCWGGRLVVCEDGEVLPCVFERNIKMGNVKESSLAEIMNNSQCKKCWECSFDQIEDCKICEFRFACKDCRPLAIAVDGEMSKNPRCCYNPITGEWK